MDNRERTKEYRQNCPNKSFHTNDSGDISPAKQLRQNSPEK